MLQHGKITQRKDYLDFLASNKNAILLGRPKIGKTTLLRSYQKQLKNSISVFIDLEHMHITPEQFSVEFASAVLQSVLGKGQKRLTIDELVSLGAEFDSSVTEVVSFIANELSKIKPNQKGLLEKTFSLLPLLSEKNKIVVLIDNFEHIVDMNNFSAIDDVLALIPFDAESVSFALTSSRVALFKDSSYFESKIIELFDEEETKELIAAIGRVNSKTADEVFRWSKGHPFVATLLLQKHIAEKEDIKKIYLDSLTDENASLHLFAKSLHTRALTLARGQTLLKHILTVVASDALRLSDIARAIYRSAPVTKAMLERLVEADVIVKEKNTFVISDTVLQHYLNVSEQLFSTDEINAEDLER